MRKILFIVVAVLLAGGAWYAFRPEKLFINQQVSEAAPASIAGAWQIVSTGSFIAAGQGASQPSAFGGRASVATQAGGATQLQLTGLDPSAAAGLQVSVVSGATTVPVGTLNGQPEQNFALPMQAAKYDSVTLARNGSHAVASAVLEDF